MRIKMGYMFVMATCISCGNSITFNPHKVPSIRVKGVREPLCKVCFEKWNVIHRTSKGLDPVPLDPEAYKPVSESLG